MKLSSIDRNPVRLEEEEKSMSIGIVTWVKKVKGVDIDMKERLGGKEGSLYKATTNLVFLRASI